MKPASNFGKSAKRGGKNANKNSGKSGEIRIIGGQWRGRKLKVHDKEGLRPTTDRLKETVFNWLMTDIRNAKILDCFAGAGSLGFEAASRAAKQVTCVELDKHAAKQLTNNVSLLNAHSIIQVIQGDFFTACNNLTAPFDVVFIDPPFHHGLVAKALTALTQNQLVINGGLVYLEYEVQLQLDPNTLGLTGQFELLKEKTAGQVTAALYRYVTEAE